MDHSHIITSFETLEVKPGDVIKVKLNFECMPTSRRLDISESIRNDMAAKFPNNTILIMSHTDDVCVVETTKNGE